MINREQGGVVLGIVFTLYMLGNVLYFYYTIQEEWMANILVSTTLLSGSFWLIFFWVKKLVFPFLKIKAEGTLTGENQFLYIPTERNYASRWMLGFGTPLVSFALDIIALLYFPISLVGILILIVIVLSFLKALFSLSFFTKSGGPVKSANLENPSDTNLVL